MKDLEERLTRAFPELEVAPLEELATGFHSVAVETADGIVFRIPRQEGPPTAIPRSSAFFRCWPSASQHGSALPEWRIEPGIQIFRSARSATASSGSSPGHGIGTCSPPV